MCLYGERVKKKYEEIILAKKLIGKRVKCPMCKAPVGCFIGNVIKCWQCGYEIHKDKGW